MNKQILTPILILSAAGLSFAGLSLFAIDYQEAEVKELSYAAKVETLKSENHYIQIPITGTVKPANTYSISSIVAGRVNFINSNLVEGAKFKKDDFLFSLDPHEYLLKQQKANSEFNIANSNLEKSKAISKAGILAWDLNSDDNKKEDTSREYKLATGLIDVEINQESLDSKVADLSLSELDISRTEFNAPCDGVILEKHISYNQFLEASDIALSYACSDYFYVQSEINTNKLTLLEFDDNNNIISPALIYSTDAGLKNNKYKAEVISLLANLDDKSKMATVLLKVNNPLQYNIPLFINSFVKGFIQSKTFNNIIKIEKTSLRNNSKVWLIDQQNRLTTKKVEVAFTDDKYAYIKQGLQAGDRIITSDIPAAINGIKISIY